MYADPNLEPLKYPILIQNTEPNKQDMRVKNRIQ